MRSFRIYWTSTALKQREYIFNYWNKRNQSKTYSRKLRQVINERISLLKSNPKMGRLTEYINTRAISLGHYSILYRIIENKIIITGFWDNRQEPEKLLKFLKRK